MRIKRPKFLPKFSQRQTPTTSPERLPNHGGDISDLLRQGLAFHQSGHLVDAERCYREVLNRDPDHADGLHLLGVLAHQAGRNDSAATLIETAIKRNGRNGAYFNNLGTVLLALDQPEAAAEKFQRALSLNGDLPGTQNNLGLALRQQGKYDEARACFGAALKMAPDFAMAHNNLGLVHKAQADWLAAESCYRKALVIQPDLIDAWQNYGFCLNALGLPGQAVICFAHTMTLGEASALVYWGIGNAYRELGKSASAINAFRASLLLKPDHGESWYNLGNMLFEPKNFRLAIICFRRVLLLGSDQKSDRHASHGSLETRVYGFWTHLRQMFCEWDDAAHEEQKLLGLVRNNEGDVPPFVLLSLAATAEDQLRCARRWMTTRYNKVHVLPSVPRVEGEKIRVGYLSADFHQHATVYLIAEMLERHDHSRFEVVAYSIGHDDGSAERQRVERAVDRFVTLDPNASTPAQTIHADGIDILVDLKGLTSHARPEILAARPAGIQVAFLGYPGTTGADFIDYIIADPIVLPMDQQPYFSERIVHMPGCYQPNDSRRRIADTAPSRVDCGLPAAGFVFCSFNNTFKITPKVFDVWMRLLRAVPGSVMWLLATHHITTDNLRREAAARGIDPKRLVFAHRAALPDHLARHRHADLFLDTLPCNAHTTASDALWAGLPLLTCRGTTFAGRVAASLLTAVGLPELIAESLEQYEELAQHLATDATAMRTLRERLAVQRGGSPLFDGAAYARKIEAAFITMVQRQRNGLPPEAFAVDYPLRER